MAKLTNCSITFHTTDNDKDGDTHVTIRVIDADQVLAASADDDFGHFDDHSNNGPYNLVVRNASEKTALQRGSVAIHIDPNGHDTWHFNFDLDLSFDDQSHLSGHAADLSLDQNNREQTFGLQGMLHE